MATQAKEGAHIQVAQFTVSAFMGDRQEAIRYLKARLLQKRKGDNLSVIRKAIKHLDW